MKEPRNPIYLTEEHCLAEMTAGRMLGHFKADRFKIVTSREDQIVLFASKKRRVVGWYPASRTMVPRTLGRFLFAYKGGVPEKAVYFTRWWIRADFVYTLQQENLIVLSKSRHVCLTARARILIGEWKKKLRMKRDSDPFSKSRKASYKRRYNQTYKRKRSARAAAQLFSRK